MFVIVNNNSVIWGPKPWSKPGFERVLRDDLEITFDLPPNNNDFTPIVINENTSILRVIETDLPEYNPKIQRLNGPYWNFFEDRAEMYFQAEDLPLYFVRQRLREAAASIRYDKEVRGLTANVQNTTVTVLTTREARSVVIETLSDMQAGDTVEWKFPEGWLTLTRAQMIGMRNLIKAHIVSCFNWEKTKTAAIETAPDLATLDTIVLTDIDG
jgi:hypothetical protein